MLLPTFQRHSTLGVLAATAVFAVIFAARLLAGPTLFDEGTRALDEGLPQVAAYKLRAFFADGAGPCGPA